MHSLSQYLPGVHFIALGLLVLALLPYILLTFFQFVILDLKEKSVVDDLKTRGLFDLKKKRPTAWRDESDVKEAVQRLYGSKRFLWPASLLVIFNLICFSMVWDLIHYRWASEETASTRFYTPELLAAAEFPIVAFLGVTIFNYGHMLRRLYVWDLTPHVFWNAAYRLWLVLAVATVLSASSFVTGGPGSVKDLGVHGAFFFLGFIINSTILKFIERAQVFFTGGKRSRTPELGLGLIQGISFWHEYRLEEEGIENVQNLATCDIIELALNTRYNLRTLLDWVDQAILIHRVGEKALELRAHGLISGAIDMAWAAPQNGGEEALADEIAKTLGTAPIFVTTLMDGLFQDTQVRTLWDLWQSKDDSGRGRNERPREEPARE